MATTVVAPNSPYGPPKKGKRWLLWLLAIILILAAGFGGWWYAGDQANKDKAALQAQITDLKSQVKKAETANGSTLVIKEWGVKLTVGADIKDAVYAIKAYTSSPQDPGGGDGTTGGQGAYFSTKALISADADCDALGSSPLGGIFRTSTAPKTEMNAIHLGSHYFYYQNGHQSSCSGKADAVAGADLLEQAMQTIAEVQ